MKPATSNRRRFLKVAVTTGTGMTAETMVMPISTAAQRKKDVGANEDLMREHGVLRCVLLVNRAAVAQLLSNPGSAPAEALLNKDGEAVSNLRRGL